MLSLKSILTKSLQIEFVIKFETMLERKVWYGVQIYEGGSTSASGFGPGLHIRQRILTGGPNFVLTHRAISKAVL